MAALLSLPNELLHLISVNLHSLGDVASIILANRRLASVATLHLHRIALKDKNGMSALHWASKNGYEPLVLLNLDAGRDVNIRDENGQTPLHLASAHGHEDILTTLLARGADICARDEGHEMPIHTAASAGRLNTVQALLDSGADPNAPGMQSNTPIHCAVQGGRRNSVVAVEVVQLLLERGADIAQMNEMHRQAYFYASLEIAEFFASITGYPDCMDALQAYHENKGSKRCPLQCICRD